MFKPTTADDLYFIGLFVEGFLFGLYSGLFAMYLQYQASEKATNETQNRIIFYSMCALYVLSAAVFVCDAALLTYIYIDKPVDSILTIAFIDATSFALCDFIAQFILIYRCWVVWGRNIHVVIIPSILTFAFLGTWLACTDSVYISSHEFINLRWGQPVLLTSLALSLTVNALVMGLLVFKIVKVFRAVKATSGGQNLVGAGGSQIRRLIFILIESGMTLFSIQLARLLLTTILWSRKDSITNGAMEIVASTHQMYTGITPTLILVRTSMGLSFHDKKSMEEVATGSVRFASNHPNSVPEIGSINIVNEDGRDGDMSIRGSNDIDTVERDEEI